MHIKLLGEFSAQVSGQPVPIGLQAARHVLLCLALSRSGQIDREQTASTFWPETDAQKAKSNLRQAVFRLRKELEKFRIHHILNASRDIIELDLDSIELDSNLLLNDIRSGRSVPSRTEVVRLEQQLLTGIELENEALTDWVRFTRADFRACLEAALKELLNSNKTEESRLAAAQCLLEFDPTNEEACRFSMQRYFERGESAQALRCYSSLWVALSDEFDVEPSAKTQEIAVQIKVNAPATDVEGSAALSTDGIAFPLEESGALTTTANISIAELAGLNTQKVYLYWFFSAGELEDIATSPSYVSALRYAIEEIVEEYPVGRIQSFSRDEYLLEFDSGTRAIHCALAILRLQAQKCKQGGSQITTKISVVGHSGSAEASIATAHKLANLSNGNSVIVTSGVRDLITASVDAVVEDLGEATFEGYAEAVRCFRLCEVDDKPDLMLSNSLQRTVARIAIIPLEPRTIIAEHDRLIGEVFADELIYLVSSNSQFEVISRQSTKSFCGRESAVTLAGATLDCDYIVSGWFSVDSDFLEIGVELSDGSSGTVIFSEQYQIKEFQHKSERVGKCIDILNDLYAAVGKYVVKKLRVIAPVALESHKLLTAAINMMNSFGSRDFFLARKALDVVISRSPYWAPVHAMLAEWRVMRAQQGWMVNRKREGALASDAATRALDCDPDCSSAHVADGVVQLHFFQKMDLAQKRYDDAIDLDSNNCLAWFSRSILRSFMGQGQEAICDAMQAIKLSPVDPSIFLYQSALANAHLANSDYEKALFWSESSLQQNRLHLSSLRMQAISNWLLGNELKARQQTKEFLSLYPEFSIAKYTEYAPTSESRFLQRNVEVLRLAGVPD